jgi:hypothetical protein
MPSMIMELWWDRVMMVQVLVRDSSTVEGHTRSCFLPVGLRLMLMALIIVELS